MIKKTMTITSLAILVAAISVATTMTLVQADTTGDTVNIDIPQATLTNTNAVVGVGDEYSSTIPAASAHPITVDITGGAGTQTVEIDLTAGSPGLGNIVVTIDGVQWRDGATLIPGAIGSFACSLDDGATATPLFDKDTLKVIIAPDEIGAPIDIDCEFVGFHGEIDKEIVGDCILEVKRSETQMCTFNIEYDGARATIIDTISAGWKKDPVVFTDDGGKCSVDGQKNKKSNNKSATGFTCSDVGTSADFDVKIETRESPGLGHGKKSETVFKPTTCSEPFDINSGAKAILLDGGGAIVLGTLDGKPIVLDSTDPLSVTAVNNDSDGILCSEA